jgi:DDE superfamily endonuclease/Tc5 transposase DNA-binding domain/Fission yeast centromere protein N-terminal domain
MAPKRQAITDADRRNIRRRRTETGETQAQTIAWFAAQPSGRTLTQGQISTITSSSYAYLDSDDRKNSKLNSKRSYQGDYPDLEDALYHWHIQMEKKKAILTGDILKAKAHEIWSRLPQYSQQQEPKWSNGWLNRFKKRHNIKEYKLHGEGASADVYSEDTVKQMDNLRAECSAYALQDIFNMDETGLFWKLQPDRSLATHQTSGGKKSKDRITIALTVNADGSEKLEPWIIGRSKNPRCLKHIKNRQNLRIVYEYNKTKWMTGAICKRFLQWFDNKMRGRKVLLLLDNFSGHELGVQKVGGLNGLENVKIRWLPPNTTSHWQPLDQGIIASFKLYYRRQWVDYILQMLQADKDPNKTVNLLKAIQWTRIAWNNCVTNTTIQHCFVKSTVVKELVEIEARGIDEIADQEALQAQMAQISGVQDLLTVEEFINPTAEEINDLDEDIMEAIVETYGQDQEDDIEEEGDEEIEPPVSISEAIYALETLQRFELAREDRSQNIKALDSLARELSVLQVSKKTQMTLDSFFVCK